MLIDVSRLISPRTTCYPGDPPARLVRDPDVDRGGDYSFTRLELHSHIGTHLDAPAHFIPGGASIGDFQPADFCPLAEVVDCRGIHLIEASHLVARASRGDTALLLRTDAGEHDSGEFQPGHSGLSVDAAKWLLDRPARLVGIDYLSVEPEGDAGYPVHHILLGGGFLLLEHLDLREVAAGVFRLVCLPLRLEETEAAPCRAMLVDASVSF